MNLYDMTDDMKKITEYLDALEDIEYFEKEEDEETAKGIKEKLLVQKGELIKQIKEKSENYIKLIQNLKSDSESLKKEEERLKTKRQLKDRKVENLKELLIYAMHNLDTKKLENSIGSISLRQTEKLEIQNENIVPEEYKKQEVVVKIDKNKLKKDIKETGEVIDGVKLIKSDFVVIK